MSSSNTTGDPSHSTTHSTTLSDRLPYPQRCNCWRSGDYCSPSAAGPTHCLWWFGQPGASQYFKKGSKKSNSVSYTEQPDAPTGNPSSSSAPFPPLSPPSQLKHFYAVQELRDTIRDLWTTSTLSETIPENSKIVIVDARLPLHIVIRSLIEYKRSFVVIFCEESGQIVGEFNVNDIVELFIHFWKCLVDRSYTERIGDVLGDYVTPQFRTELIQQASQFSESSSIDQLAQMGGSSSTITLLAADTGRQGSERLESSAVDPNSNKGDRPEQELTGSSTPEPTTEAPFQQQQGRQPGDVSTITHCTASTSGPSTPWTTCLTSPGLSGSSRWCPNDLRKVVVDATDPQSSSYYSHIHSYSSSCSPRTSVSSQNGQQSQQTAAALFGGNGNQVVSDRWILAVFLSHHHREVFLPLPPWFSVRLFEDPSFTPERFRKLRRIMNRKMYQESQHSCYNSDLGYDPFVRQTSGTSSSRRQTKGSLNDVASQTPPCPIDDGDQPTILLSRRSSIERSTTLEKRTSDVTLEESASVDSSSCSRREHSSSRASLSHLVPPPWTSSLDLWKRLSGPTKTSSLLGINPNRPPIEAALLLVKEHLSQVVVWNEDRSSPLHFLSSYSLLNHVVQHLRGQHSALDLLIRSDLGMGVPGDQVISVDPNDSFYDVLDVFRRYKWSSIPIVERPSGRFKGFINRSHILALVARVLQTPSAIYRGSLQGTPYRESRGESPSVSNPRLNPTPTDFIMTPSDGADSMYKTGLDDQLVQTSLDLDEPLDTIMQRRVGFSYEAPISYHSYKSQPPPIISRQPNGRPSVIPPTSNSLIRPSASQYSNMSSGNQTPIGMSRADMKSGHSGHQPPPLPPNYPQYSQESLSAADGDLRTTPDPNQGFKRGIQYGNIPPPAPGYYGSSVNSPYPRSIGSSWYNTSTLDPHYSQTPSTSVGSSRGHLQQQPPQHPSYPIMPNDRSNPNLSLLPSTSQGPSPTAVLLTSHGISFQTASASVLNAVLFSPAVVDNDITLRDCIGHILLTDEHRVVLVDPNTQQITLLISIGDILAFLLGYCCDCKGFPSLQQHQYPENPS